MKKIVFLLLFVSICFAQAPQKLSYQAVVRNATGNLVVNSPIRVITSIYRNSPTGTLIYQDWHLVNSNANGLIKLEIGTGSNQFGVFSNISWADGPYFLKTQIDPDGNFTFGIEGDSELLSVPYALFAEKSNPVNPVFQYSQSEVFHASTVRGEFIEYPYVSITVAKSGLYLINFNGSVLNTNLYISATTFDANASVALKNVTTNSNLFLMNASSYIRTVEGFNTYYSYFDLQPSKSTVVRLNKDDILKVYYIQTILAGATAPTQAWSAGPTSVNITKVGD